MVPAHLRVLVPPVLHLHLSANTCLQMHEHAHARTHAHTVLPPRPTFRRKTSVAQPVVDYMVQCLQKPNQHVL